MSDATVWAGAAKRDITPPPGTHLAGLVGKSRPAETFLDPLYARVAVFQSGERKLCIISIDVTFINRGYTAKIREAARLLGFEAEAVMVHATQNHNAPPVGRFLLDDDFPLAPEWSWIAFGNDEYDTFVIRQIIDALQDANKALQPVEIGVGSGFEGRVAFNRRGVMRDGNVMMPGYQWPQPLGWTQITYLEGPIDPELGVLAARDSSSNLVTALLNYTCHPVHLFTQPGGVVSADWPGVLCDALSDGNATPLTLNGPCGNINPWNLFDPDYKEDHIGMGNLLADTARKVIGLLEWKKDAALDWKIRRIKLPIREVPDDRSEQSEQILSKHPEPFFAEGEDDQVDWGWMSAALARSVELERRRAPELDYEIQVLRIGDAAFVGLPGEPFVEGALAIKLASPTYPTYVVHATSHYAGYIPTREAFARGGHEVALSSWAKLEPQSLEMIIENATDLLHEVFAN